MQIHLSPRHLTITDAIDQYITEKIGALEEIASDILAAHVVLLHVEGNKPPKRFCVKVHLAVPGPDIHIEDFDADLYAAIDNVATKLARQLRKRKTKILKTTQNAQKRAEHEKLSGD